MTRAMQRHKLQLIRALSLSEIEGWREQLRTGARCPFAGELSALASREKQLRRSASR
jgi:hypothetical protein